MDYKDIMLQKSFNGNQTSITEELVNFYPTEVLSDLHDVLSTIKFTHNLTKENRKQISDYQREVYNDNGDTRIIITKDDIVDPHILVDMDFFRERALYFKQHKKYTDLPPSKNPNSDYYKFWKEEIRRWNEGLVRESDGEWIPGSYYFYLNYSPILINMEIKKLTDGQQTKKAVVSMKKKRGERKVDFPEPWLGDYLWYHYKELAQDNGNHGSLLKARQKGFSYKMGAEGPRNMHILPNLPNYYIAIDNTYLTGMDGILSKAVSVLDWVGLNTPLPKLRLIDRNAEKKLGYKDEYGHERGLKSSLTGISVNDNPHKARGIRAPLIVYEEGGTIDNIEMTWNINRNAVEEGNVVFGMQIIGGTGGTKGAKFEGMRKIWYSPTAYNVFGIPNVFDKGANGSKEVGFFWPAYLNRKDCYDSNGNPDVIKALLEILHDRFIIKYNSLDAHALTQRKAEEPITPQEAILRVESRIFPVADLKDIKEQLILNAGFDTNHYIGTIVNTNSMLRFVPTSDKPIREFPLQENVVPGAVEIFELPKYLGTSKTAMENRYIAAMDPYANDAEHTDSASIGAFYILDLLTDRIVAEYSGRPVFTDDYFETCIKLAQFYNAKILYENNIKGLYNYALSRNYLWILMDRPSILADKDLVKAATIGNTSKGCPSSENVKMWSRTLIREWLLTVATEQPEDIDVEDSFAVLRNMHTIKSPALLEELITWNPDGNFDRVSALQMLMIARAEWRLKYLNNHKQSNSEEDIPDDAFVNKSFYKNFMLKHKKVN